MKLAYDMQGEKDFSRQLRTESRVNKMMADKGYVIEALSEVSADKALQDMAYDLLNEPSIKNHVRFAAAFSALAGNYFEAIAEKEMDA
jgi:hypothetical protein